MTKHAYILLCLWLCACVATTPTKPEIKPTPPAKLVFKNAGFEGNFDPGKKCPPEWLCKMHIDPDAFEFAVDQEIRLSGKQSLRITRLRNEPWAVAIQIFPAQGLTGKTLRLSAQVRTENIREGNGGGLFFLVKGPNGMVQHKDVLVQGTRDWQRLTVTETIHPEALSLELGFTLEGEGRVWIDEAEIEVIP